ncbi:MAG: hypothetical protein KDE09_13825 [Anaerolineales bacterium]|nr:hypothetical protein [Anaerolineales bacterium]
MEFSPPAGPPALQPLSLGQLLDRAFRLYRQHFLSFVGIIAIVQIPAIALQAVYVQTLDATAGGLICLGALLVMIGAIFSLLGQAALVRSVGLNYLGQACSFRDAYADIRERWTSVIGMFLLLGLMVFAIMIGSLVAIIVGWMSMLGMLMYFSAVVARLALIVLVLERLGASDAIWRAWAIGRRRFWWTLGFMFILSILSLMITAGPSALVTFGLQAASGATPGSSVLISIAQNSVSALLQILYLPLQTAALVVMYVDYRVRYEGFDLALQLEDEIGIPVRPEMALWSVPKTPAQAALTWTEWAYFVVISIAVFALYFGFVLAIVALMSLLGFPM